MLTTAHSKIGPMPGMNYRGIPVDGDNIRNWDGPEPIKTGKTDFNDVEDLVSKITDDEYEDTKASGALKTGSKKLGESKKSDSPLDVLEMDVELEEESDDSTAAFEDNESEIITRLIREMKALDDASSFVTEGKKSGKSQDEDGGEDDGEEPILDLDSDEDGEEYEDEDEEDEDEDEDEDECDDDDK